MSVEVPISLPLDDDGFLRRACPQCGREFKWHDGPVEGVPDDVSTADEYYCPYCGEPAAADQWWTEGQLEYATETATLEMLPQVLAQLREALQPSTGSGFLKLDVRMEGGGEIPPPLIEDPDMVIVASPCHPYEPVKIVDDWASAVHCLVCGSGYLLPEAEP